MAQHAGARVWHCRVQAALLLKRTPEYADTNLICPLVSSAVAAVEASARRSWILSRAALAQRAGATVWHCRVQAALLLKRTPEYADNNLKCALDELSSRCCRSISP